MSTTGIPRNETVLPLENSSVMAEALMPTVIYNSTDGRDQSLTEAGGLIAMVLITILGAVGNTCLVVIILVSKNLRKNLTHAYVLNLACIDGLASILLLPLAAVTFSRGSWQLGTDKLCYATGFLHVMLHTASILGMCIISAERYYSIAFPMRHSANLTTSRTVITITITWLPPLIFSSIPYFMSDTGYYHEPRPSICLPLFDSKVGEIFYVLMVTIFCFCIPAVVMGCMYFGILQVARKTAIQVGPIPGQFLPHGPNTFQREERFIFVNVTTQTDRTTAIATVSGTDRAGGAYTNTDHVHSQVVRTSKSPPHTCKAFRTLLLVYGSFLCLWVPYYVISLISPFQSIDTYYVLIATWLGYASFAINPFFYGWLNRSIREQIVEALQHCKRKILCRDPESAVRTSGNIEEAANGGGLESGGAFEDFYQFIGCKASYDARNRPGDTTNIEQRF